MHPHERPSGESGGDVERRYGLSLTNERRHRVLPSSGVLLISTDLHGNLEDFEAMARHFSRAREAGHDVHWALLGDLVHGPDEKSAAADPRLLGFTDQSPALIDALWDVRERHPDHVHFVLGNHDAGHIGFAHTAKFHADEVEFLEAKLTPSQRTRLRRLFSESMLVLLAPCGVLLAHGVPGDALDALAMLDGPLVEDARDDRGRAVQELLWSYGQTRDVAEAMLSRVSAETGLEVRVVVHGHDRDPSGYYAEHGNQAQPVIFGAPRELKRFLWLDLGATYRSTEDFREGVEVRRLYD